ncbi:MAG: ribosome small subunit-dependent GTPase A [Longilinea sp.]|nr:ribosome small subunit-dependent GTPase A [Longilinea sp.]MCA1954907.1 ribosome small subunit-dependent GTPase A [Anaerolinea sp.]
MSDQASSAGPADWCRGRLVGYRSGLFVVLVGERKVFCRLRGRLKRGRAEGDLLSVGDVVQVRLLPEGTGIIEQVEPRTSALVRRAPSARGEYQQVLAANLDQALLVFACADPEPHLRMLDRFLVICEKQNLPPIIVANKVDLVGRKVAKQIFGTYAGLGYEVLYTSTVAGTGIQELRARMVGKISGVAGPSGVGKSSLINAVQPGLGLAVRETSVWSGRGRHTTVARQMYPLSEGGFVVDLPGLRSLSLWDTQPEELDGYFPELRQRVAQCQFNDCTHQNEPGCAVVAAVERGEIDPQRYESYLRLRFGDED